MLWSNNLNLNLNLNLKLHTIITRFSCWQIDENHPLIESQTQENITNISNTSHQNSNSNTKAEPTKYITPNIHIQRKLPALAVVNKQRIPNAYDKTALKLEVIVWTFITKITKFI